MTDKIEKVIELLMAEKRAFWCPACEEWTNIEYKYPKNKDSTIHCQICGKKINKIKGA